MMTSPLKEVPSTPTTATKCLSEKSNSDGGSPILFYGICTSDISAELKVEPPLVFTDKAAVLQKVKKYSGARFKAFLTEEEAYHFSTSFANEVCMTPPVDHRESGGEKVSAFRAPKSQDTVRLRKAIEKGDKDYFLSTVWSNPRYLIASGDTPTIMQEGFRYTALHIAARYNQPDLCKLVLNVIQDLQFLQLLYCDDPLPVQERRIKYLTDLYLNLPDKGLSETPLHFACKFGCIKVVEILLSYQACDRNHLNKYGCTARKIICDRCSTPNKAFRRTIDNLFEDRYFVPVLRSDDNTRTPVLARPCTPEKLPLAESSTNPVQSALKIHAVAGPMSPELASQFYKEWKGSSSPISRSCCRTESMIQRTDSGKGFERVGRVLAREHQVGWNEFWPFLNDWCNFSTSSGLKKLEECLQKINAKILKDKMESAILVLNAQCDYQTQTPEKNDCGTRQEQVHEFTPVTKLCMELENLHIHSSTKKPTKSLAFTEVQQRHFCIKNLCLNENDGVRRTLDFDSPKCEITGREKKRIFISDRLNNNALVQRNSEDAGDRGVELFLTPPSSPSSVDSPLQTPEEIQTIFITGSTPSKVDFDVFHVLEDMEIDPLVYPLVFLWKDSLSQIECCSSRSSWTPQRGSTLNSSFYSLPEYENQNSGNCKAGHLCWTFPVKKKLCAP